MYVLALTAQHSYRAARIDISAMCQVVADSS